MSRFSGITCDRCGKEQRSLLAGWGWLHLRRGEVDRRSDICPSCADSFHSWCMRREP